MKTPQEGTNWFFVDESGDPTFYDRRGNLIVGTATSDAGMIALADHSRYAPASSLDLASVDEIVA